MVRLSLKSRVVLILLLASLVPFLTALAVSYGAIANLVDDRLRAGVSANLHQERRVVETAFDSLNRLSQQLSVPGPATELLDRYLQSKTPTDLALSRRALKAQVDIIVFSNPNVGLVFYWFGQDGAFDFETSQVRKGFDPTRLAVMKRTPVLDFHTPHPSGNRFNDRMVLSIVRQVDPGSTEGVSLYCETSLDLAGDLLADKVWAGRASYLMLDAGHRVVYSDLPREFPAGLDLSREVALPGQALVRDHYLTAEASTQGWTLVSLVPQAVYDGIKDRWMLTMGILGLVFFVCALGAALGLWRWLYRPLVRFGKELAWLESHGPGSPTAPFHIPEFDTLMGQFQGMKRQVVKLLDEVGEKERRRADLEIEKLRYQINPHFLLNSLNTIHWHATLQKQPEIDSITLALMRLLQYNLGKTGTTATLAEELAAVADYVELQKTRYQFTYRVVVGADGAALETRVPRFLLQPLVENAIAHGLREDGTITVEVQREPGPEGTGPRLCVRVGDDGAGMEPGGPRAGLGIGLDYVRRMAAATWDDQGRVEILSAPGAGTTVVLSFPEGGDAS